MNERLKRILPHIEPEPVRAVVAREQEKFQKANERLNRAQSLLHQSITEEETRVAMAELLSGAEDCFNVAFGEVVRNRYLVIGSRRFALPPQVLIRNAWTAMLE